jgi:hypothetical protein
MSGSLCVAFVLGEWSISTTEPQSHRGIHEFQTLWLCGSVVNKNLHRTPTPW